MLPAGGIALQDMASPLHNLSSSTDMILPSNKGLTSSIPPLHMRPESCRWLQIAISSAMRQPKACSSQQNRVSCVQSHRRHSQQGCLSAKLTHTSSPRVDVVPLVRGGPRRETVAPLPENRRLDVLRGGPRPFLACVPDTSTLGLLPTSHQPIPSLRSILLLHLANTLFVSTKLPYREAQAPRHVSLRPRGTRCQVPLPRSFTPPCLRTMGNAYPVTRSV
ncbi:hypothetical protein K491DRAFT_252988 [Lophiostoma macrostomum CBS 122681]|uniref:Uncharacterized protein n=1 Tax=Lophiostoma macrostomum CBS 122681 TaxID=1314788 RepID=A0A6A6TF91_9PLEO|nr:hypothetical protein K491DRAFT_252988 [Lophiostoma macrostomum CBS 122681]